MGGGRIESTMRFFRKHQKTSPQDLVVAMTKVESGVQAWEERFPGFGQEHGDVNCMAVKIAELLLACDGAGKGLLWGEALAKLLRAHRIDWTLSGVAAAVFSDLGFHPRSGVCLFQLMSAPGAIAHGLELANKPITAMPYVSDDDYVIERERG